MLLLRQKSKIKQCIPQNSAWGISILSLNIAVLMTGIIQLKVLFLVAV